MLYSKLFLPLFFLSISFGIAFGEIGTLSVVSDKQYQINYDAAFTQILGVQPNKDDQSLLFSIQVTEPTATLELTLPRELIGAAKKDGSDDSFIVLVDGTFSSYLEKNSTQTSRTILVQLAPDNKELEIIGTYLGGYNKPNPQPIIPTPVISVQQNQTSQNQNFSVTPIKNSSVNASPNESKHLSIQEILSKMLPFDLQNASYNILNMQVIEYAIIAVIILIIIIVLTSSIKSKSRKR